MNQDKRVPYNLYVGIVLACEQAFRCYNRRGTSGEAASYESASVASRRDAFETNKQTLGAFLGGQASCVRGIKNLEAIKLPGQVAEANHCIDPAVDWVRLK